MERRLTLTAIVCCGGAAVTAALLALPPSEVVAPAAVAPAAVAPSAVASSAVASSAGSPAVAAAARVEIEDFAFGAARANRNATVVVTNIDDSIHSLTSDDGLFDTGTIRRGAQASFVAPGAPGTYRFTCVVHPSMTGSLVVS